MAATRDLFGFGFVPGESEHHFVVSIPRNDANDVEVTEWFSFGDQESLAAAVIDEAARAPRLKLRISHYKWSLIADEVRVEFNRRLRGSGLKSASWKSGDNFLAAHFGRELMLLLWAIEDADPSMVRIAVANWDGLVPEERWWLYTTINAASGHPEHGRGKGWRKAIGIAFTENPVGDRPHRRYEDLLDPDTGRPVLPTTTKGKKRTAVPDPGQEKLFDQ
ncbi:MAG: DUF3780 domain-containing protein [Fimbriimonadaceae bacterium]|nr:DUF3780 domain-containing protein [Fimbriimonadaceae bacterium]